MHKMDEEAKIADAKKYVINMLQRPGQLEKVPIVLFIMHENMFVILV